MFVYNIQYTCALIKLAESKIDSKLLNGMSLSSLRI